ncbi:MAG: hypothetical protein ACQET5_11055 [Halobacteriota archaeon]
MSTFGQRTDLANLHREGDRVVVDLSEIGADGLKRQEADCVVITAGAWVATIGAMAGVDPTLPVPKSVPLTIELETALYFRPERTGWRLSAATLEGTIATESPTLTKRV